MDRLEKIYKQFGVETLKNILKKEMEGFRNSRLCILCECDLYFEEYITRNTQVGFFSRPNEKVKTIKEALEIWMDERLQILCCDCNSLLHEIKTHKKLAKKYKEKEDLEKFYRASLYYWGLLSKEENRPDLEIILMNLENLEMTEYIPYIDYLLKRVKK